MASTNGNTTTQKPNSSLRKVECLVCQKVVYPPVMQCKNWHLVCNNCRQNLTKCPDTECQEEIGSATRSGVTEKFLEKYVVRCKYFKEGLGCLEASLKDEPELITIHEGVCHFREVKCLVPGCYKNVRLEEMVYHFESNHSISPNTTTFVAFNVSEMIMMKSIINETCGERTYKCICCYLKDDNDVFLAIFRISSLRTPVFELSTVIYPYYADSQLPLPLHACRISASNEEDPNASYRWEGPLSQPFPLVPILSVQDERAKLKWVVSIEVFRKP